MVRPRWHDVVLVVGIVGILVFGLWAIWWDDVRDFMHLGPGSGSGSAEPAAPPTGTGGKST